MRRLAGLASVAMLLTIAACSSPEDRTGDAATTVPPATGSAPTTSSTRASVDAQVMAAFPDPASVATWRNVDDSVMGGVSDSSSTWSDAGGGTLVFAGRLSTERNGGFSSTVGPTDRSIGTVATGARAIQVDAIGDGRTYLLQLRAGPSGADRWIARFTPPNADAGAVTSTTIPLDAFESVGQFLRPTTPSGPLDPATISQIGVYVLDGQVGEFRLALVRVVASR